MTLFESSQTLDLKPRPILRYGDRTADGLVVGSNAFWFSRSMMAAGVPVTLEFEKPIGRAYLSVNDRGVIASIELTDVCSAFRKLHSCNFDMRWKPGIQIDDTEITDDAEVITRARIYEVTLIPKTIALPSALVDLRLVEHTGS